MSAHNFRNLTGERFERVRVLSYAGLTEHRGSLWNCVCDCGTKFVTRAESLVHGATRSCGCIRKEKAKALLQKTSHNRKPTRVVTPEGVRHFFGSQHEAAAWLGCSHKTIWKCTQSGRPFRGNVIQAL